MEIEISDIALAKRMVSWLVTVRDYRLAQSDSSGIPHWITEPLFSWNVLPDGREPRKSPRDG